MKHNFHRGGSTFGQKLVFSLFRESDRDDSISYRDWWAEVEAAWPKATSLKELRSSCLRLCRVWLKTMQPT